ncbi:carbohydrate kinase [Actinoplanes sp. NPDC089786]|uniref:carbohydrate kinase family protein n=1 Tax=Actinoplanes sp. NPDC089786 TaxID=3155185 RepID=UPI0034372DC1
MTSRTMPPTDVLVIGEALGDIVDDGSVTEHVGGSPANVALGLGRRGLDVALLTQIGRDTRGSRIARHLERSGVRLLDESFSDHATSTATATVAADGSADYRFDVQWRLSPAPLPVSPTVVHTGSIAAFLEPGRHSVLAHIDRLRPPVVTFDPNIRADLLGSHPEALNCFRESAARADLVKMSDEDAAWIYPSMAPDEVARAVGNLGPRLVVITRGARGATLTTATSEVHLPSVKTPVADTIGAGDTYMASLILDLLTLRGHPLDVDTVARMGERAAQAAAITVSRPGADLPWAHELAGPEVSPPSPEDLDLGLRYLPGQRR